MHFWIKESSTIICPSSSSNTSNHLLENEEEAKQSSEQKENEKKQTDGCSSPHCRLHISTLTLASHWKRLLLSRLSQVSEPKGCVGSLLSRGRLNTTTAVGPTPVVGFWGGSSQLVWEGSPHPQLDPQLMADQLSGRWLPAGPTVTPCVTNSHYPILWEGSHNHLVSTISLKRAINGAKIE